MILLARRIALTILCVRLFVIDPLEFLRAKSINDYASFHSAAVAIAEGLNPYDFGDLQRAAKAAGLHGAHPYFYPPLLAELLVPFTWLDVFSARMVWWAMSAAALLASVLLLDRYLRDTLPTEQGDQARTAFMVVCAAMWPIRSTQWMAQVNGFVLLLLVVWWTRRDKAKWAGAALGAAVAIKMSPALLILVPLAQKRFREAAVATGCAAGLILASSAILGARGFEFLGVLTGFLPGHRYHDLHIPIGLAGNHSLAAFAFWMIDHLKTADPTRLSRSATILHVSLIAIFLGAWLVRARKVEADANLIALGVLMIIAPTFGFEHHVAFMVLPVALIVGAILEGRVPRGWAIAAGIALAILVEHETSFILPAGQHGRIALVLTHEPLLLPMLVIAAAALASKPRATA